MKDFKIILIVILLIALIFSNFLLLMQLSYLRNDNLNLTRLLEKEKELEKVLSEENLRLSALIAKPRPAQAYIQKQEKAGKIETKPQKGVIGNRGFLIREGKPTISR